MPWVKVPAAHHPLFHAALPADPRVETMKMFGGVAAKVNGHIFAGLFGLSTMVLLSDADRAEALALDGAAPFDPMGDGRMRSDKVMLPAPMMRQPAELRRWIARAFRAAAELPAKPEKKASGAKGKAPAKKAPAKKAAAKKAPAPKKTAPKKPATSATTRSPRTRRRSTSR